MKWQFIFAVTTRHCFSARYGKRKRRPSGQDINGFPVETPARYGAAVGRERANVERCQQTKPV